MNTEQSGGFDLFHPLFDPCLAFLFVHFIKNDFLRADGTNAF